MCFLHSFEPGGVERTALRLCRAWRAAGIDAVVAVGRKDGRLCREAGGLDIRIAPRLPFPRRAMETAWMILWLPWIILRLRPDVLYCPGNSYTIVAAAMKLLLGRRCPPVVAKISNDLERADLPAPVRMAYHLWCRVQGSMLDRVIAMSPEMVGEIVDRLGVSPGRVSVVHDPVFDLAEFGRFVAAGRRSRISAHSGRRFIAVGRLVEQKNFEALIDAFARGSGLHDELVILGDGPSRQVLQARIDALDLADRIWMPGHVDETDAWLAHADILLLSSRYEGVPAVVIEALAAGLPIIATDCCASIRSLLEPTGAGWVVPVGDIGAMATAIAAVPHAIRPNIGAARLAARHTAWRAARSCRAIFAAATEPRSTAVSSPPPRIPSGALSCMETM